MNRHGSMNRVYRLIWSFSQSAWVVVGELARGRGKSTLRKLMLPVLSLATGAALAAPEGGQVTAGAGSISQTGATTTINQTSQNLSLSWNSFNIGASETVNFAQPSATAIAVNRILDTNGSQILGHLNANGQVYLINPNGILFGQGAQVNVGALVASTLDLNDAALTGDSRSFSGTGAGSVINRGVINTGDGGYVALLANDVSNSGAISTPNGAVALGAGSAATLTFSNSSLVRMQVDASVLNSQADNGGLIRADGGIVMMTAGAKDSLLASVVNNTGVIEAQTVENRDGKIILLGGMAAGTVNVAGTLDASAPTGGDGGFIETSAAHVKVADEAKITTAASMGLAGTWLIDPVDFTIAASGGDMTGATLSSNLGGGNVVIQSTTGSAGTLGDVNVNDAVSWSANKLTLNAQNNININANLNASNSASLALEYGQGAVAASNTSNIVTNGATVNLPASTTNFTTKQGSDGIVKNYTVITSLGAQGSTTTTDLQGMSGNLALNYVLGADIDASATSAWNAGAGFQPIGGTGCWPCTSISGTIDGLGHTVSGLTVNRPSSSMIGLFGYGTATSVIRNIGLSGGSFSGASYTGTLIGRSAGTVFNSFSTASVTGTGYVGGLIGRNYGTVSDSYATGNVVGSRVGGLIGRSESGTVISNSHATGSVTGSQYAGGLVGDADNVTISNTSATGNVTGGDRHAGGLVGRMGSGSISDSYATGNVSGVGWTGGLVGDGDGITISNSHATGNVTSTDQRTGGLIGHAYGITLSNSYATGSVIGTSRVGGLFGYMYGGSATNTYALGAVSGTTSIGGLVGYMNYGSVIRSYSVGAVSGSSALGGLVGGSYGASVSNSYWNTTTSGQVSSSGGTGRTSVQMQTASNFSGFNFTTTAGATGNNWVMVDVDGTLNNAGGAAGATRPMLASEYSTTINNAHQLQLMRMDLAASYTLGSDIDAAKTGSGIEVWGSKGFVPIGSNANKFTGTFDGANHTVSGLTINAPANNNVALFGYALNATISNVGLIGVDMHGDNGVAALVATSDGTSVVNNSYATGSVNGNDRVGGLVGGSYGAITSSSANVNVTGSNSYVGGLVGRNYIAYGGSFGNNHATGAVSGSSYVGGLIGSNDNGTTVSNSYSTGSVTGLNDFGGLIGKNSGAVFNSHYDFHNVLINGVADTTLTTGALYTAQYQDWFSHGLALNVADYSSTLPGSGNNYSVSTVQGLKDLLGFADVSAYTFTQTGNIDLSGQANLHIPYLAASFDGGGYSIANLNVAQPLGNSGLFGWVASGSTVSNVNLLDVSVDGIYYTGGLAGQNNGTVSNSTVTGSVNGTGNGTGVGGLVGVNNGTVNNSSSAVNVTGVSGDVGGLVGRNAGSTINSHATGNVNSDGSGAGALVGVNDGTISDSYATTGTVNGTSVFVGGLVGWNRNGQISNSHASTSVVSTSSYAGGLVGYNYGGSASISNSYATGSVSASGVEKVGGLAGASAYGSINNSYSTGNVSAAGSNQVGGLIGYTYGSSTVSNSYATGAVLGGEYIGGLVGFNSGSTISNSHATGSVTGSGNRVGGLVGNNQSTVTNSYATGAVIGAAVVGGLVGGNQSGTITNSYATGAVSGSSYVGGLVGAVEGGTLSNDYAMGATSGSANNVGGLAGYIFAATISNTYATGAVSGSSNVGGLIGMRDEHGAGPSTLTNNYWNTDVYATGVGFDIATGATGLTRSQMQTGSNFTGFNFTTTPGAAGNNWVMVSLDGSLNSGQIATLPMLASEYSTAINNAHQLQLMSMDLTASYTLGQNINAVATAATNDVWFAGTFIPVGKDNAQFTGTFDGLGHTIDNLTVNLPGANSPGFNEMREADQAGLFGYVGSAGVVQNVGLVGGSAVGRDFAGMLAGQSAGTINNSYATGTVQARSFVGGLVGYNTGGTITASHATGAVTGILGSIGGLVGLNEGAITGSYATGAVEGGERYVGGLVGLSRNPISNSYASGTVSGVGTASYVGGLVGKNYGDVQNSYASGDVDGVYYIGGLLGINYGAVSNTYATGAVQGTSNVGGLISGNYGSVTRSFWNTETSGQATSVGGTGLTSTQMMQLSSFSSWNTATPNTIASTGSSGASWRIYEGSTAPLLTQFLTALTLSDTVVATYDGAAHGSVMVVPAEVFAAAKTNAGSYAAFYSNQQGYDITGGTLTINKANLTLSGTRSYDGTTAFNGSALTAAGVAGETFTLTGVGNASNLASKNVQTGSALATLTGLALGTSANGGLSNNYNALSTTGSSINITRAGLILSTNDVTKTYDGSLTALGTAAVASGTLFSGDTLSGGTFAFTNANAGAGNKTVTTSGVTVSDGNSGGNYNVGYVNNTTSTINAANLILSTGNVTKTYDGSLAASGSLNIAGGTLFNNASNGGVLDNLSGGTFAFTDANASSGNKTVTTSAVTVSDGNSGGNYNVTYADNTSSTISKANLTISTSDASKTYNGTLSASGVATVTSGMLFTNASNGNLTDSISGGTFAFTDANAGSGNKTVTTSGVTVSDGNSGGNYNVTYANNTSSTISKANLTIATSDVSKTYDGTLAAVGAATVTSGTLFTNVSNSNTLDSLSGGTFAFTNKNVGSNKAVATSGVTVSDGNSGGNYAVSYADNTSSSISAADLVVTGVSATNKVYDSTTVAALLGSATVTAFGSDEVAVSGTGIGQFADPIVGTGKAVTVSGFTLSGGDAGNYAIVQPVGLSADITAVVVPATPAIPPQVQTAAGQIVASILLPLGNSPAANQPALVSDLVLTTEPSATKPSATEESATNESSASVSAAVTVGMNGKNGKPLLQILGGGMKLPDDTAAEDE